MTLSLIERNTPSRQSDEFSFPIAANTKVLKGTLAHLNSAGFVESAATATGKSLPFLVAETVDNTGGSAGAAQVKLRRGCFRFANSAAGDAIANADYGSTCYVVDNQTVAKTNGGGTRSAAGVIRGTDAVGVWVEF